MIFRRNKLPSLYEPRSGVRAAIVRNLYEVVSHLDYKTGEHYIECKGWDHDDPDYCCCHCACCPCWSLRCNTCRPKRLKYENLYEWAHRYSYDYDKPTRYMRGNDHDSEGSGA